VVDIRKDSSFFGEHLSIELDDISRQQLFIPKGFAHGFVVLTETAIFAYKVDNYYMPECEKGIAFDDKELGIDWRISKNFLKLSENDKNHPAFSELPQYFS
jgi:dTDP-4-dehydrorhamnose 3,5-epimerase